MNRTEVTLVIINIIFTFIALIVGIIHKDMPFVLISFNAFIGWINVMRYKNVI